MYADANPVQESRSFDSVAAVARALQPSYPVLCVRPRLLEAMAKRFMTLFPGKALFAVKCNPHPMVLNALYRAGIRHFDVASLPEIAQVCDSFHDARAYFMHPVKSRAVIKSAFAVYGIRHFAVDHMDELKKVYEETGGDGVTVVVRIKTPPAEETLYHLAAKFGADPQEAADLMREARNLGMSAGLSFHVGSQCMAPGAYSRALGLVGGIIEEAGIDPVCVDVGGGFPAAYVNMATPPLEDFVDAIRSGLKAIALKPAVEVWSEPGRAMVAAGCSLLVQVQLRKGQQIYINDGIYGSLSEMNQVGIRPPGRLLRLDGLPSKRRSAFTINGPTCDSLDVLPGEFKLPQDVREGDWIEIDQMGAYSNALATHFNGFHPETFVAVYDDPPCSGQ